MTRPLGVAIVGCGNIADRYAADLARQQRVRLVGVTDRDEGRATAFAEANGTRAYPSLEAALADEEVAIVVNLTSHRAHVPVSSAAIRAGRHVFSEKPIALRADEAQQLLTLAREHGVRIASAPIVGMGELAQTARRWVTDGRLGQVRLAWADVNWGRIEEWHPDPAPFYAVGPLVDVGVYPLTVLTGLFGPIARVTADARRLLPERRTLTGARFEVLAPDYIVASLEMEDGPIIRLTADFYVADPARQRGIELHGDEGSLWMSNWSQFAGTLEHAPWGEPFREVPLLRTPEVDLPWAAGLDDLAAAVTEGREPAASAEQAAHVVDVMETIQRAAAQGRSQEVSSRFTPPPAASWAEAEPLPG